MDILKDLKADAYDAMVQIKLWTDKLTEHNKNIEAHQVAATQGTQVEALPVEPIEPEAPEVPA